MNPDLMRALGRLVRGLSALFWGLPATLVICFHTAQAEAFRTFGIFPPLACTGLLVYGLWLLGAFQKQERVWRNALDWARLLALINFGLSPFLYWSNRVPDNSFFWIMKLAMLLGGLLFLASLNLVLKRLGAMLPDEALRLETRQYTLLNLNILLATAVLGAAYIVLGRRPDLPLYFQAIVLVMDRGSAWLLVLLVLLPLAMTMALLWKTKEVILESVFTAPHPPGL
ncbi:MAG: hypothetical protein ACREIC_21835 [Limisphaerales bacterium]